MKKFFKIPLTCLLIFMILSEAAYPQGLDSTTELSIEAMKELESETKFNANFLSLMLKAGESLEKNENIDEKIFDNTDKLTKILQKQMDLYSEFFEKGLLIPAEKKLSFKHALMNLNWKKLIPILKKSQIGIEVFFKRKGLGLGIAIGAGFLCKYFITITLIKLELAYLIPFTMMIPWPAVMASAPNALEKIRVKNIFVSAFGGKVQFEAYTKQESEILKRLHSKNPNDLIFPVKEIINAQDLVQSVVVQQESFKNKAFQKFGWNKKVLTYEKLNKFLLENSINDPYLEWMQENTGMDKELKTGLISSHLFNIGNAEIEEKFQKNFSESFVLLKIQLQWKDAWEWAQMMKSVKNVDELFLKMKNAPNMLTPKELAILWENILLPEYALKFDLSYNESRRAFDLFAPLKAKLITSESIYLDEQVKNEIYLYLKKITFGKSFKGCENSPNQILNYLFSNPIIR